jgi:hypothetical protein
MPFTYAIHGFGHSAYTKATLDDETNDASHVYCSLR